MADLTYFRMYVEHYAKTKVDYGVLSDLDDGAYGRFLTKAAIEISRRTSPRSVYGLSREDVRGVIHDIITDISQKKWISPQKESIFSALNKAGDPIHIFARSKKDALNIAKSAMNIGLYYWGNSKSLRKVVEISESGNFVLDSGEERPIGTTINYVNLYGHGRNYDE